MRNRIPLLFGLLLACGMSLNAAQVFVLFDPACMDRLEFDMNRPDGSGTYLVYHLNVRSGEKLVFDIGEESTREQNYMPEPYLSCNSGGIDQGLLRRINANIDEVFIVYPKNERRFQISKVVTASSYTKTGNIITYDSPKYRFRFDTQFGTIGENIAINNPGAKVYFEGKLENQCTGSYLFRQLAAQSAYPLIDLVVTPEIGIIEERSGPNAAAAMNNYITLKKVNGRNYERYLMDVCGTEPGSNGSVMAARGNASAPANYNTSRSNLSPPGNLPTGAIIPGGNRVSSTPVTNVATTAPTSVPNTAPTTATTSPAQTHTVVRGETLYGISRKYEISVDQIKDWNNLSSNMIRRGQVLQIAAPTASSAPAIANRGITPNQVKTLSSGPVPYDQQNSQRIMTEATTTTNIHIVQPGETLASIALQYGYTSKKFREINDMGPNDFVRVGQRLKTTDCDCSGQGTSAAPVNTPSVPNSFSNPGGRLAPNTLVARTPAATSQSRITPSNSGTVVRPSGGLPIASNTYTTPSVPRASQDYNAIVPSGYDAAGPRRTVSSMESSNRAIGNGTDFGNPVETNPRSVVNNRSVSPYPAPNTPLDRNAVVRNPDEYYTPANPQRRTHVVAAGESLYGIARRYGTTPDRLRQLNNLGSSDPIIEYQTLYIE